MLTITEKAAQKLIETREQTGTPDTYAVRLSVALPEGETQPSLALSFAPEAQPGDQVTEQQGLTAYIAPAVAEALDDATLDVSARDGAEQLVVSR